MTFYIISTGKQGLSVLMMVCVQTNQNVFAQAYLHKDCFVYAAAPVCEVLCLLIKTDVYFADKGLSLLRVWWICVNSWAATHSARRKKVQTIFVGIVKNGF